MGGLDQGKGGRIHRLGQLSEPAQDPEAQLVVQGLVVGVVPELDHDAGVLSKRASLDELDVLQSFQGILDLLGHQGFHVPGRGSGIDGGDEHLAEADLRVAFHGELHDGERPGHHQQDEDQVEEDGLAQ